MAPAPDPQQGLLKLNIPDKKSLYAAYMPFVTNGGLFIPTDKPYRLGADVFVLVNIEEQGERLPVSGKVVWITPKGAQGRRQAGIGVQFSQRDGGSTQKKIETALAGMMQSGAATLTM